MKPVAKPANARICETLDTKSPSSGASKPEPLEASPWRTSPRATLTKAPGGRRSLQQQLAATFSRTREQ
jgi:hypothetical protein